MSSTNRGTVRNERDFYITPAWCVDRLLDAMGDELPFYLADEFVWLEPCVGDGAIVRAVDAWAERHAHTPPTWVLNDIAPQLPSDVPCFRRDYAHPDTTFRKYKPQVAITNPPFSSCDDIVAGMLADADDVLVLQRLAWLAGDARARFWATTPFNVYVLPNRPSFTSNGKTDSTDYAWFHFARRGHTMGRIAVLASTPLAERNPKRSP